MPALRLEEIEVSMMIADCLIEAPCDYKNFLGILDMVRTYGVSSDTWTKGFGKTLQYYEHISIEVLDYESGADRDDRIYRIAQRWAESGDDIVCHVGKVLRDKVVSHRPVTSGPYAIRDWGHSE